MAVLPFLPVLLVEQFRLTILHQLVQVLLQTLTDFSLEELDAMWNEVKRLESK